MSETSQGPLGAVWAKGWERLEQAELGLYGEAMGGLLGEFFIRAGFQRVAVVLVQVASISLRSTGTMDPICQPPGNHSRCGTRSCLTERVAGQSWPPMGKCILKSEKILQTTL